ncbi:hypothetical protein [Microbacterium hydrocarbonoxydans]|uniref:hypothetical protein n=1 Tax=Microbacterium hydrocarbonoxydans TaxID=273678 RepID=UPI003D954BD8
MAGLNRIVIDGDLSRFRVGSPDFDVQLAIADLGAGTKCAYPGAADVRRIDGEKLADQRKSSKGSTMALTPCMGQTKAMRAPMPSPPAAVSGEQSPPHSEHVR